MFWQLCVAQANARCSVLMQLPQLLPAIVNLKTFSQSHEVSLELIREVNRQVLANQHTVSTQVVNNMLHLAGVAVMRQVAETYMVTA